MRYTKYHKTAEIARLPRAVIAGGASIVALVAVALALTVPQTSTRKALPDFKLGAPGVVSHAPLAADKPVRLVYRNSVVPGGVHSAAELAAVIARDPIAAAHYANFDVSKAHLVLVEKSRMAHVSYRIGNQIFWTKNKVRLAEGEALLSDGTHLIRARCGNRLADEAEGPTLLNEPAPEVLETAFVSAEDLIDQNVNVAAFGGAPGAVGAADGSRMAPVALAAAARPFGFDSVGNAGMGLQPFLSGGTLLPMSSGANSFSPHAAPALPIEGGTNPVANGPTGPVSPGTPGTPGTPGSPGTPGTPGNSGTPGAPTEPVTPGLPVSLPGGGKDPVSGKPDAPNPDAPGGPFIEPPIFTPPVSIPAIPTADASVPEPGSALLAGIGLILLIAVRVARRRPR